VVVGGPGTGKTSLLLARAAWLLGVRAEAADGLAMLAPGSGQADELRRRLVQHLAEAGLPGVIIREAALCVLTPRELALRVLGGGMSGEEAAGGPIPPLPAESLMRPVIGAIGERSARRAVAEAAARLVRTGGPVCPAASPDPVGGGGAASWSEPAMMRLGVAVVQDARHRAARRLLRVLRRLGNGPGELSSLVAQARRTQDVVRLAPRLAKALAGSNGPQAQYLAALANLVALDMAEVASREAAAAPARAAIYRAAAAVAPCWPGDESGPVALALKRLTQGPELDLNLRHLLVDDVQALGQAEVSLVGLLARRTEVLVCADRRGVIASRSGYQAAMDLLGPLRRATTLKASLRMSVELCGAVNALIASLWPCRRRARAPSLRVRRGTRTGACPAVEVTFVRRREPASPGAQAGPESFSEARRREAEVVAQNAARLVADGVDVAVLAPSADGAAVIRRAIEESGLDPQRVEVTTIDRAMGRQWDAVMLPQLDDQFSAAEEALVDHVTGLPMVAPAGRGGIRVHPRSTSILKDRAAARAMNAGKRRFYLALTRARTRLLLSGLSREEASGGFRFSAPIEWLRRCLVIPRLSESRGSALVRGVPVVVRVAE
jgi:hypothetical protein